MSSNLNQFRKKRERAAKAQKRAANRARSGRTKTERQVTQAEAAQGDAALDGKRIDHDAEEPEGGGRRGPRATERRIGIRTGSAP